MRRPSLIIRILCLALTAPAMGSTEPVKTSSQNDAVMQQSVRSAKENIDREMLDNLYRDAEDAYRDGRYSDALETLDQLTRLNPNNAQALQLKRMVKEKMSHSSTSVDRQALKDYMSQADAAARSGQQILAASFWKKALEVDPNYAPAKTQLERVNKALAQKQYEQGYLYYHQNDAENALDAWSNAIALDPAYRKKGLLVLMSRMELQAQRDQANRLKVQGDEQFRQGNFDGARQTFEHILAMNPRDAEARKMVAKCKITIGKQALAAAQKAYAAKQFKEAGEQADKAIKAGYEVATAKQLKEKAAHPPAAAKPRTAPTKQTKPVEEEDKTPSDQPEKTEEAAPPPASAEPKDPEQAMVHYRKGLAAIRAKEYRVAIEELDTAWQFDSSNERIYLARERAHQEGAALYDPSESGGNP